jgi:hypothetical protein
MTDKSPHLYFASVGSPATVDRKLAVTEDDKGHKDGERKISQKETKQVCATSRTKHLAPSKPSFASLPSVKDLLFPFRLCWRPL